MKRSEWIRVTRARRCPCCDKADWCSISADGAVVHCMRVESAKPVKNGGWIHRLSESVENLPSPKPREVIDEDWGQRAKQMYDAGGAMRLKMADELTLSLESLDRLYVGQGYDWNGKPFASFPSRDDRGQIIGISRRYDDGSKKTMNGSHSGCFVVEGWFAGDGEVWLPEGPTDVAACLDAGIACIGRSTNRPGRHIGFIARLIKRRRATSLIVVWGERDEKPDRRGKLASCPSSCEGCAHCYPGLFGVKSTAKALTEELGRRVKARMPPAPYKDVREWLRSQAI